MQRESSYQKSVVAELRRKGFFVGIGSLAPGYPDLTAIHNSRCILIELKDISGWGLGRKSTDMFQKTQLPFYCRFSKDKSEAIIIAIKRDSEYYMYTIRQLADVRTFLNTPLDYILSLCAKFKSVKELVNFITL